MVDIGAERVTALTTAACNETVLYILSDKRLQSLSKFGACWLFGYVSPTRGLVGSAARIPIRGPGTSLASLHAPPARPGDEGWYFSGNKDHAQDHARYCIYYTNSDTDVEFCQQGASMGISWNSGNIVVQKVDAILSWEQDMKSQ